MSHRRVLIEGYTLDALLQASDDFLHQLIFTDEPVVLNIGSARVLGQFRLDPEEIVVQLAEIDGGGEGVLPTLWSAVTLYAKQRQIKRVHWVVHAVSCAKPNLKLRRLIERRGFAIRETADYGRAYYYLHHITL
jgi:hypothetical protein